MEADSGKANTTGLGALTLSVGAAVASVICIVVIALRGLLSYEKGADWSVSLPSLILRNGVWLIIFAAIAWMSIAAIRVVPRKSNSIIATGASAILAILSLVFAVSAALWTVTGALRFAKHPNYQIYGLYVAACKGDKEAVKRELARGVSPSMRWADTSPGDGGDAVAAYFKCYRTGQPFDQDLVEILLAAGSSLSSRPEGYGTPPSKSF